MGVLTYEMITNVPFVLDSMYLEMSYNDREFMAQENKYHMIHVFKNEGCSLGLCHVEMIAPRYSLSPGVDLLGNNCTSTTIELESWKAIKMK